MKKVFKSALVVAASAAMTTFSVAQPTGAANAVTKTADGCNTAWAILLASHPTVRGAFPSSDYKEAIMNVVKHNKHWTVGGYEKNVSQKFALQTFDTRFYEGGTAFVAHCGHGATCNALAEQILKNYPESGSPVVYCTVEPPVILDNPQSF